MALQEGCRNPRRDEILKAQNESMEWIWDDGEPTWAGYNQKPSPGFVKWIQSEGRIFWIYGKPGAGKSTLMKQLTQSKQMFDLMPRAPKPVITVSYFFYELGRHQERQSNSLLMAILSALLQTFHNTDPRAFSSVMGILEPQLSRNPRDQKKPIWKDEELQEALRQTLIVCQISASLLLFVDGIDECEGDHRGQLDFLRNWIESSTKSKLSIKACIASRDETEIRLRLSMHPSFPIHRFTKANISAYVTRRLEAAWKLMSVQPDYTTAIFDQGLIDALVDKAEGVFLWVDLVVTQLILSIEEDKTVEELRMQLDDMPDGLRKLYSRIVDKIPQRFLHDTTNFLRMYDHGVGSSRDLIIKFNLFTLWQFCAATEDPSTAISCKAHFENGFDEESTDSRQHLCAIMKRRIQRSCRGLIHVEDTNDLPKAEVTLLHRTVKEFIIRDDKFRLLLARADQQLLRDPEISLMAMSLRLLKVDLAYEPEWFDWERMEVERWEHDTSWESDIVYLFLFAAATAARNTGSTYKPYIDELDRVLSSLHPDWGDLYYESYELKTCTDWNTNMLCLAVAHGMDVYLEEMFKSKRAKILDRNRRPLMCYLFDDAHIFWSFSPKLLETLLNNGADPNEQFQEITPWTLAVRKQYDLQGIYGPQYIDYILIFQTMLEHGANPTQRYYLISSKKTVAEEEFFPKTLVYTTTFHVMLSNCYWWDTEEQLDTIRLLLRYCKDFDAADSDGTTISEWADVLDERHKEDRDPEDALLGEMVRREITARRQRQRVHALWK